MRVLVVGATGMLGYSLFSNLSEYERLDVFGTARELAGKEAYFQSFKGRVVEGVDVCNLDTLDEVLGSLSPDVVVNCVGLIKQHNIAKQHVEAIEINALLPHQLARLCEAHSAKLIHFSTDCVFSGKAGGYTEKSVPDAQDVYGKSKNLGEVAYAPHLTLRTSIIGHELGSSVSLVDWFLSQSGDVDGYSKAVFSGLPTCYIAQLLANDILVNTELSGLYHLSVNPINKYELLNMIASEYGKSIDIKNSEALEIDRSLNSDALRAQLKLNTPSWPSLISEMHKDFVKRYEA